MSRDYYEILELDPSATIEEVKKAYRRLALIHHPDKNKEPDAHDRFIRINEAYLMLSDAEARAKYDSERESRSTAAAAAASTSSDSSRDWTSFDDADLRDWSSNARRQAEHFASMSFYNFASTIGQVAKESALQLGNALAFAISAFLGTSAIFAFLFGLAHGDAVQVILSVVIGALCMWGLSWSGKKYQ